MEDERRRALGERAGGNGSESDSGSEEEVILGMNGLATLLQEDGNGNAPEDDSDGDVDILAATAAAAKTATHSMRDFDRALEQMMLLKKEKREGARYVSVSGKFVFSSFQWSM